MSPADVIIFYIIFSIIFVLIAVLIKKYLPPPIIELPRSFTILMGIAAALLWIFNLALCIVGIKLLLYLMFAVLILAGPILLLVGLRMLYVRLYKLLRCRAETEGHIVDYVLSPWKYVSTRKFHVRHRYYSRWFPVVEYEAGGQRFRQQYKTCVLSNERPNEETTLLRYNPKHPKRFSIPAYTTEFSLVGWVSTALFLYVGGGLTSVSLLFIASWMSYGWDLQSLIQMQ